MIKGLAWCGAEEPKGRREGKGPGEPNPGQVWMGWTGMAAWPHGTPRKKRLGLGSFPNWVGAGCWSFVGTLLGWFDAQEMHFLHLSFHPPKKTTSSSPRKWSFCSINLHLTSSYAHFEMSPSTSLRWGGFEQLWSAQKQETLRQKTMEKGSFEVCVRR